MVSNGLPDAAVATGTLAMDWKLPALVASVGTAAQPEPKSTPAALADGDAAADADVSLDDDLPEFELPHAPSGSASAPNRAMEANTRLFMTDFPFHDELGP